MKVYLAGYRESTSGQKITRDGIEVPMFLKHVRRMLWSYHYIGDVETASASMRRDLELFSKLNLDLFLDSGAYSAFTKGAKIPVKLYGEYVKKTKPRWSACSSLDAIGQGEESAIGSRENFLKLKEMGAVVQPVFHVREPDRYLEEYIAEGHDYIFIGGMVPETNKWLKDRLDSLWTKYLSDKNGRPVVKTHGFGLTDQELMFRYPWFSVDSTSWLMTGVFGNCVLVNPATKKIMKIVFSEHSNAQKKINSWHFRSLKKIEQEEVRRLMEPYDITPEQCASHYTFRDCLNAAVFQDMEKLGTDIFKREQVTLF